MFLYLDEGFPCTQSAECSDILVSCSQAVAVWSGRGGEKIGASIFYCNLILETENYNASARGCKVQTVMAWKRTNIFGERDLSLFHQRIFFTTKSTKPSRGNRYPGSAARFRTRTHEHSLTPPLTRQSKAYCAHTTPVILKLGKQIPLRITTLVPQLANINK